MDIHIETRGFSVSYHWLHFTYIQAIEEVIIGFLVLHKQLEVLKYLQQQDNRKYKVHTLN